MIGVVHYPYERCCARLRSPRFGASCFNCICTVLLWVLSCGTSSLKRFFMLDACVGRCKVLTTSEMKEKLPSDVLPELATSLSSPPPSVLSFVLLYAPGGIFSCSTFACAHRKMVVTCVKRCLHALRLSTVRGVLPPKTIVLVRRAASTWCKIARKHYLVGAGVPHDNFVKPTYIAPPPDWTVVFWCWTCSDFREKVRSQL